ncbi:helix-turn-helix transcriptional regulator [Stratiformator vulcanicus]|uniref:Helix-turn-helix domain protein n=1 Tax=Stratiformator vulcanicus TaxID=2527980 RepID=A0A517R1B9_9PLAN|nr:helix-turn-helix transcriptional regulator [Stratiformator vulcanicus]QDT37687.1 Helix-turn-helix domain protein [Stratiformator vulcanicus]
MAPSRTYDEDFERIVENLRTIFGGDYPAALRPVGKAIKALRLARTELRTQGDLAAEAGVDQSTISRLEQGKIASTETEKLYAISFALGVPLNRIADVKLPNADTELAIKSQRLLIDRMASKAPGELSKLIRFNELEPLRFGIPLGWQLGSLDFFSRFEIEAAREFFEQAKADVARLLKIDRFSAVLKFDESDEAIGYVVTHYAVKDQERHAAICIGMCGARQAYSATYLDAVVAATDKVAKIGLKAWAIKPLDDVASSVVPSRESLFLAIVERDARTHRALLDFLLTVAETES